MDTEAQYAENCKTLAMRLFKTRHEVSEDWDWRSRRRQAIRGYIGVWRQWNKEKSLTV